MILTDANVWIDHFRKPDAELERRLQNCEIALHPFIVTELALGPLPARRQTLGLLDRMPQVPIAQPYEMRQFIEIHSLHNRGLGLVDVNLLASALLQPGTSIWTRDRNLRHSATQLGIDSGLA